MAMRRRGGSATAPRRGPQTGGSRAVYEDFRPVSEWKQDDESHILNVYLPGFSKEQISVSTEGQNTIRVRGERLVGGNKWSRFLEDFQVPENGEMNSVRAKFQGGVLNITVPIKHVVKLQEGLTPKPPKPKPNESQNPPTNVKNNEKVASTSRPIDESTQQKTLADPGINRGPDEGFQGANSSSRTNQSAEEKSLESQKAEGVGSERPDGLTSNVENKERNKNDEGMKKLPEDESVFGRDGIPKKKVDRKELDEDMSKEKYKKAVEGLAEVNEERQLLVNMGAAMLVIVALTAYVTYKFASGKDKN